MPQRPHYLTLLLYGIFIDIEEGVSLGMFLDYFDLEPSHFVLL